jgi:uncharacterized membrane protein
VAEQAALSRRAECRRAAELERPADIVEEGSRHEEVGPKPWMHLGRVTADRCDRNRVLEQPTGVVVVHAGARGQLAQPRSEALVCEKAPDEGLQARMAYLAAQELEKSVELVDVAPEPRGECGGILAFGRFEGANLELKAIAVLVHARQHADCVPLAEAAVEQLDVAPDSRFDSATRIDQLQRQVVGAGPGAPPLLSGDRVDAFDDAVLLELGDRAHASSLGAKTDDETACTSNPEPLDTRDMTSYEFLLIFHVLAVIVWLGAGFTMDLLFMRAERTGEPREVGTMGQLQGWLVPRLFIPASLATLVSGVLVTWDGPWAFDDAWIAIGLAAWLASFGIGFLFLKPQGERTKDLVAQFGPASVEVRRHARRLGVVARVQLLALFLVVADMVLKPTTDDPWTLAVLAAILAAAAAAGALTLRRPPLQPAPEPR